MSVQFVNTKSEMRTYTPSVQFACIWTMMKTHNMFKVHKCNLLFNKLIMYEKYYG
jgi:hypothetical protein